MAAVEIKCPGGEIVHPVLSRNKDDVQCRIQGGLRPAREGGDSGPPAVCCADYWKCRIWQTHVEVDRLGPSTKKQRDHAVSPLHQHA